VNQTESHVYNQRNEGERERGKEKGTEEIFWKSIVCVTTHWILQLWWRGHVSISPSAYHLARQWCNSTSAACMDKFVRTLWVPSL